MVTSSPLPAPIDTMSSVPSEPPAAPTGQGSRSGPRLRPDQRKQIGQLLVWYHDPRIVQLILQRDYPDIPTVSDRTLRQIREQLLSGANPEVTEARRRLELDAFSRGLAVRAHRVLELQRTHGDLLAREFSEGDPTQRTALTRERRAVLAQIAREVGHLDREGGDASLPSPEDTRAGDQLAMLTDVLELLRAERFATPAAEALDLSAFGPPLSTVLAELQHLLGHGVLPVAAGPSEDAA